MISLILIKRIVYGIKNKFKDKGLMLDIYVFGVSFVLGIVLKSSSEWCVCFINIF